MFSNEVSKNSRQQMSSKDSFKGRTTYSQLNASRQFESKGRDEIKAEVFESRSSSSSRSSGSSGVSAKCAPSLGVVVVSSEGALNKLVGCEGIVSEGVHREYSLLLEQYIHE